MGHPDLSADADETQAAHLRIAICGSAGSGRRTLLAALGCGQNHLDVVGSDHGEPGGLAVELLEPPPVGCGVLVVDAPIGIEPETLRDLRVLAALGVREVAVAINKMDLVGFSAERFAELVSELRAFAAGTQLRELACLPVCALHGDNVREASSRLAFAGETLLGQLESFRARADPPSAAAQDSSLDLADGFQVMVVWTGSEPLLRGRAYTLQLGGQVVTATVAPIKYRLDIDSGERLAATALEAGQIGCCVIELSQQIRFAPHDQRPDAGTFTLTDRVDGRRLGIGTIEFALRRSQNVRWQRVTVDKASRCHRLGQQPAVLWLTGLSGAGKSTIANFVEAELHGRGHHTYLLDGDNVRHGLNADLGFSAADRVENIRRIAEVARLMVDAGMIVIVSFISPFRAERRMARELVEADEFIEVFVDTPLAVAERRDPKGLYEKARRGQLTNFTGIDSPYEPPEHAEIRIDTTSTEPDEAAAEIVALLERRGRLTPPAH